MSEAVGKRLLSIDEAARYLSVSPRTLYNSTGRRAQKHLPFKVLRIGKKILFDIRELDRFIEAQGADGE